MINKTIRRSTVKKLRIFLLVMATSITLLLTGCWIPENFAVNVTVNKDGSYTFAYDGTLIYVPALAATKEGSLTQKDEEALAKLENELRQEQGFKEVSYLSKGRYKILVEKSGDAGEHYDFFSRDLRYFSIIPQQDGSIQITTELQFGKKEDIDKLKAIGANINGTLTVSVENGVTVINHNAQSEPKLFGLFGGYEWEIKSFDTANAFIVVQPSS